MSELKSNTSRTGFRQNLFVGVSAFALLLSLSEPGPLHASEETGGPLVWIDVGGQLERLDGTDSAFNRPFMSLSPTPGPYEHTSPLQAQRVPRYSMGEEGSIHLQPGGGWVLSASVRYGRSNGNKIVKHQTSNPVAVCVTENYCYPVSRSAPPFAKTFSKHSESHTILDFAVGRDVGVGLFGSESNATLSAGVRFAQFQSRSKTSINARPSVEGYNGFPFAYDGFPYIPGHTFNQYTFAGDSARSFHGVGPAVSWSASTPISKATANASLALDWGLNASILFGRQRASGSHQTTAKHYHGASPYIYPSQKPEYSDLYATANSFSRSRSIVVPNVGAFAALSLKFPNAKVSLGYRGDFFFGAMDEGIDARKTGIVAFHGPYAAISFGLGG